ncbi:hypothetical protein ABE61_17450 [Lysinibacillus sphaericus]|uniref:hypothetical protein n=1 Tax=Lysinibacillus sphaericus TaxID=1421 RepID=UPI0018CEF976|nr:hypothetical protein [Lysinibacillus sphaericus]MBG9455787.1 hypothetical protein [Lysinibacillus sphaericus]MBG9477806.1 hypothetical protein [Lysinibacillus sphaericus]MBG9593265.1 hypothetical protein [Lysinibacillus sphaericus]
MSLEDLVNSICIEAKNRDSKRLDELLNQLCEYENVKILDIYPYQIKSNEKFSQVEVFFDKLESKDFQQKTQDFYSYFKSLEKFEKFFEMIWLGSTEFYAFYDVPVTLYKDTMYYKFYEKEWNEIIQKNREESNLINIDEFSMLISLIKLAVSDHLDVFFIIPEKNIVFRGNGLAFIIYSENNLDLFEKIANTEGLYIR